MAFINRKQFYFIHVQGVCDSDAFITNIVARRPRSTHDSRIFENSRKAEELREGIIDSLRSKRSRTKSFARKLEQEQKLDEGFAGKRSLSRSTSPCFVEFLLSLQSTRGQNAEKLFARKHWSLLRRIYY